MHELGLWIFHGQTDGGVYQMWFDRMFSDRFVDATVSSNDRSAKPGTNINCFAHQLHVNQFRTKWKKKSKFIKSLSNERKKVCASFSPSSRSICLGVHEKTKKKKNNQQPGAWDVVDMALTFYHGRFVLDWKQKSNEDGKYIHTIPTSLKNERKKKTMCGLSTHWIHNVTHVGITCEGRMQWRRLW